MGGRGGGGWTRNEKSREVRKSEERRREGGIERESEP